MASEVRSAKPCRGPHEQWATRAFTRGGIVATATSSTSWQEAFRLNCCDRVLHPLHCSTPLQEGFGAMRSRSVKSSAVHQQPEGGGGGRAVGGGTVTLASSSSASLTAHWTPLASAPSAASPSSPSSFQQQHHQAGYQALEVQRAGASEAHSLPLVSFSLKQAVLVVLLSVALSLLALYVFTLLMLIDIVCRSKP